MPRCCPSPQMTQSVEEVEVAAVEAEDWRVAKVAMEEEEEENVPLDLDGPAAAPPAVLRLVLERLALSRAVAPASLASLSLLTASTLLFSLNALSRSLANCLSSRRPAILVNSSLHSWRATSSS